jgi:hypothetical protein
VAPLRLPAAQRAPVLTLLTAAAHILVNRRDARLQPGPRRYTRAYLRDAVGMGTALARLGMVEPLKRLLDWYGPFQRDDGELPDCVDDDGAEWLPEYDAYGQYLHGVAEALRLAPDPAFLARQWPRAQRVLARLESLRARRLDEQYRDTACFGLLPESMSHEGYMAQPVHAYWDDFWALRGLRDVAWLAAQAGDEHEARRIAALAVEFRTDLHASLARSMATHGIDFIPGSVELGDFDATAIAIALTVADDGDGLPRAALDATFRPLPRDPRRTQPTARAGAITAPTRSASSAPCCASGGATTRWRSCMPCWPTAAPLRGASGQNNRGATTTRRPSSVTCRIAG